VNRGDGNIDTVPEALAGLLAPVVSSSWWKAPQSEIAVLLMEAKGPVADQVRSTVNGAKGPFVKPAHAGVVASITAWTVALDKPLPNPNVFGA
jgi:hypothetical protein